MVLCLNTFSVILMSLSTNVGEDLTYEQVSKFEEQYICMNRSTFNDVCIYRPYFSTSIYMNRLGFENTAGSSGPI